MNESKENDTLDTVNQGCKWEIRADFSSESVEERRQLNGIFKELSIGVENCQLNNP